MHTPPMISGRLISAQQSLGAAADQQGDQHHGGADGDDIGLEQVGGHAGAVADIVADIVGDHGRVAGIVLGDSGLDLADQVGADVGGLGEDAAAETREDRDQRGAEGEGDQRVDRRRGRSARSPSTLDEHVEEDRDGEQGEAGDEHAGDRAARKAMVRPRCRLVRAASAVRTLARTEMFMPMIAGDARQQRADHEADRGDRRRGRRRPEPRRPRRRSRSWCTGGRDRPWRLPGWRRRSRASARCRPERRAPALLVTMP